jgi:hypothetical protein
MDPDANLREQIELARKLQWYIDNDIENYEYETEVSRLAELVIALVEWRAGGGVAPRWKKVLAEAGG